MVGARARGDGDGDVPGLFGIPRRRLRTHARALYALLLRIIVFDVHCYTLF